MRLRRRKHPAPPLPAESEPGLPVDIGCLDFERGVEFGLLCARIQDYGCVHTVAHADMAELIIRLAERYGLPFRGVPHEHGEGCADCVGRSDCMDGGEWLDVAIGPEASC